jgi:AraC-like DNA-binding protein
MDVAAGLLAERIDGALAPGERAFGRPADAGGCHAFLLSRGAGVLRCAGRAELELAAPTMVWLSHPLRGCLRTAAGAEGYSAAFGGELVRRVANDPLLAAYQLKPAGHPVVLRCEAASGQLASLAASFQALVHETRAPAAGAPASAGLHLGVLLLHLWRCSGLQESGARNGETTVQRFARLVELHYREAMPIGAYASRLGVSQARLHEACARVADRTPLAMVHERLLEEARVRLLQTELSVEQVGYSLGFRDAAYFNRFFKRLAGVSPGAFRRAAARRDRPAASSFAAWP